MTQPATGRRPGQEVWHPCVRQPISYQELDGELVLFDQERHEVFHLNPVAGLIFFFCDGKRSEPTILRELEKLYPQVERAQLAADLEATLAMLAREAIVC